MLTSSSSVKPKVTARSDSSAAKERDTDYIDTKKASANPVLGLLSPLAVGLIIPFGAAFSFWFINKFLKSRLLKHVGRSSSLNNIGFSLLHSGEVKEAHELLLSAVRKGADAPHSMANYGLTCGLLGDDESSIKWLRAAEFYSTTPHEKAVVHFNRGILFALSKSSKQAQKAFEEAVKLSADEIRKYAEFSFIVAPIIRADEDLKRTLLGQKDANS